MPSISITRTEHRLAPDARRVLAKPYSPGEDIALGGPSRAALVMERVLAIPDAEVGALVDQTLASFSSRHRDFRAILERHFELVEHLVKGVTFVSPQRRLLIGAYFTHEYSVEAAALFNPSIVLAPDQSGLGEGEQRFVMSLRAVGEGHLSSIEFRSGRLLASGELTFDAVGPHLVGGRRAPPSHYDKRLFETKLAELGAGNELSSTVLERLRDQFTLADLEASLSALEKHGPPHAISFETINLIRVLASSNYVTVFPAGSAVSERVIFPAGPNETRGMEDARFVRFTDAAGVTKYYATYTAYDGFEIVPQLIETDDFRTFTIGTLNGSAAQNKGMALFPRQIGGKYVMLSRRDRENLHLATSTDVRFWDDVSELCRPSRALGALAHGKLRLAARNKRRLARSHPRRGPDEALRLGAMLLNLEDPRKVVGKLDEPLLLPNATEREGYVPNVLYTCGAMIHKEQVVMPYGFSDSGISIAMISLPDLLAELTPR